MNADHDPPRVDFTLPESILQHSVMHSVVPETPPLFSAAAGDVRVVVSPDV